MAVPTVLPAEATALPLGSKRKHAEMIDLTGSDEESATQPSPTTFHPGQDPQREEKPPAKNPEDDSPVEEAGDENDDEDDEDDAMSIFEVILDQFELAPYVHNGSMGISKEQVTELRAELQRVGIDTFIEDAMKIKGLNARQLGLVMGLDPNLAVDDDLYLRLLGRTVSRAFYKRCKLAKYNTIDDAADLIRSAKNIMVITGAGISTSLGIPDFRSKGTGFYEKVRAMGYEEPEEVFDIRNFDEDPRIFYSLASEILPDLKRFTPTHAFIRFLQEEGRLQTNYTQNIDNLEALAGIDENRLIQCHGSFATATCRKCRRKVKGTEIFDDIRAKRVAQCKGCIEDIRSKPGSRPQKRAKSRSKGQSPHTDDDSDDDIPQPGVMKPDITFFGEQLPETFFDRFSQRDAHKADLVIVIGTSLKVAPVSEMPNHLSHAVPHIYISREPIRHIEFDIQLLGKCDEVVVELCRRAGWNLTHDMIPSDFVAEVLPVEGTGHLWTVKRKEREKPDADDKNTGKTEQEAQRNAPQLKSSAFQGNGNANPLENLTTPRYDHVPS